VWHNLLLKEVDFILADSIRQRDSLNTATSHAMLSGSYEATIQDYYMLNLFNCKTFYLCM